MSTKEPVIVIGGCGHVGLPLAIVAAHSGRPTLIYDADAAAMKSVAEGKMPFLEEGGEPLLREVLASGALRMASSPAEIATASVVVVVIGTPIDEYMTPRADVVFNALEQYLPHFRSGQTLVLRSTVYPGVSERVQRFFDERGLDIAVAFCPERVAQGRGIRELRQLPQIVSAFSERGLAAAKELFGEFAVKVVTLEPLEAELAKLFSNAHRYIQFATANQFYAIASANGADYHRIHQAMTEDYPRLVGLPGPGFAAGPCLFKDTMQLVAFSRNSFSLGLSSVWTNEGMPQLVVEQLSRQCPLESSTVGILGMAFKADNDDIRDSLSFKLRKLLRLAARRVLCHDPFVADDSFVPLDQLLQESDAIVVATPHTMYKTLQIPEGKAVLDVWSCLPAKREGVTGS